MMKYKIVKLPGASPEVIEEALNKRAEDGFTLEFVDSGWFILSQWDYDDVDEDEIPEEIMA
jgi:flavin-binding protein dodecin